MKGPALRGTEGFTLPELLIAIMIASMVVGGLAGVSGSAARTQARDYRHGMVANNLAYGMRYIQADLALARRVYTGETSPGTAQVDKLCIAWCDPLVGGANCSNPFKDVLPTGNLTVLSYIYYCRAQDPSDLNWKLYRDDSKTGIDTDSCPAYPACGSAVSTMMTIATNIDKMTVLRPSTEFSRNTVEVQLDGSWYSASTESQENVSLKSQTTFAGLYKAGP